MYIGCTKFQVILNLKNSVLRKNIFVNFSCSFIEPTFNSYQQKYKSLIPNWLCEKKHRKTISIRISFCQSNEQYSLKSIRKFEVLPK